MNRITYNQLKVLSARENMLAEDISSLGTQSGNFGVFTEQARIVTKQGADAIRVELEKQGIDLDGVMKYAPTLKALLD